MLSSYILQVLFYQFYLKIIVLSIFQRDVELEERLSKLESSLLEEAQVHESLLNHIKSLINKSK